MKHLLQRTLLAASMAAALFGSAAVLAKDVLESERDKDSYMIGMQIGGSLMQIKDEIDMAVVMQAIQTSVDGKPTLLTNEQAMEVQKSFAEKMQAKRASEMQAMATKNKSEGDAFLAKNKTATGVQSTASGLQFLRIKEGTGPKPTATDTVRVHYVGTLLDGTKFDSSVDRGEPAQFALNAVIPGWTEALQLMAVGSKYKLWIPSELGYGDRGTPGPIGPNSTLQFEVELIEIVKL